MIITIDGPAGAGKSTVAKLLAERLGFDFLDTGAMYRAVTLAALRAELELAEGPRLASLLAGLAIRQEGQKTWLNGVDVSREIRLPDIAAKVGTVAKLPSVRARLTDLQRATTQERNVVTEGRDQGTVVFPDADHKFFLTASDEERARRRHAELSANGQELSLDRVLADQRARDALDSQREISPLRPAPNSITVDTTGMSLGDVVLRLLECLQARRRPGEGRVGVG